MDGNKTINAGFAIDTHTLAVTVVGSGSVTKSPDQAAYDHGSVVSSQEGLVRRVSLMLEQYGAPVLVEPYLSGREFSVVVEECPEVSVMPASEIRFDERGQGKWPIFTYDAKWRPESVAYRATPPVCPLVPVST